MVLGWSPMLVPDVRTGRSQYLQAGCRQSGDASQGFILSSLERVWVCGESSPCFDFFAHLVVVGVGLCGECEVNTRFPELGSTVFFTHAWCPVLSNDLFNGFPVLKRLPTCWHTISPSFGDVLKTWSMDTRHPRKHVVSQWGHIDAGHEYSPSFSRFRLSACHVN